MQNLSVNLLFKSDVTQVKNNIQELGSLLNKIRNVHIGVDKGPLVQASEAAQTLQVHLQNAMNVNTGKLDLTKLNASLKSAGTDLSILSSKLLNAGTTGQQAFLKLSQSIASAQVPIYQMSTALTQFGHTLINTLKWQLASSLIHGFVSTVQSAVSHVKDLNRALNDIQIVSQLSTRDLAQFADQARIAAKELNTTVTEYAKASLIFYQQGLGGKEVLDRANVVIKMSEVTGDTAETVSNQLTAIWNNFYDGTESLEFYADAITALGAATASSSSEIAEGLEKFAAVADTVGLSYEYATAALATVVAETRQSADVVGTAFKTIFARLEGLKLGETLEDGTDLNKYSAALATVGVNIKDANGEIKAMDTILDELGEKWNTLSKDTQIALAQSVGGLRQYNQLLALMNNWEEVKINIDIADNSEGTLEEQQETWSKSWEAASQRVKAAKDELSEALINDQALIKIEDFFSEIIRGLSNIIKAGGGIVSFILPIIGLLSGVLLPIIQNLFLRLQNFLAVANGSALQQTITTQNEMINSLKQLSEQYANSSATMQQQIALTIQLTQEKQRLMLASKGMTEAQKAQAESAMAIYEAEVQERIVLLQKKQALEEEIDALKQKLELQARPALLKHAAAQKVNRDLENEGKSYNDEDLNRITQQAFLSNDSRDKDQIRKNQEEINELIEKGVSQEDEKIQALKKQNQELQTQIDIRQKYLNLKKDKTDNLIIGKTEQGYTNPAFINGSEDTAGSNLYRQVMSQVGVDTSKITDNTDAMQVDVSIGNIQRLMDISNQYSQTISTLTALEHERKLAEQEVNTVIDQADYGAQSEAIKNKIKNLQEENECVRDSIMTNNEYNALTKEQQMAITKALNARKQYLASLKAESPASKQAIEALKDLGRNLGIAEEDLDNFAKSFAGIGGNFDITTIKNKINESKNGVNELVNEMREKLMNADVDPKALNTLIDRMVDLEIITTEVGAKMRNELKLPSENFQGPNQTIATLQGVAQGASQAAMAFNGLKSAISIWSDEDADPFERITTTLMSVSMLLPVIINGLKAAKVGHLGAAKAATAQGVAATEAGIATSAAMWYVTVIVAAIMAIVAVIKLIVDNMATSQKAIDNAKEALEGLTEAEKEAKEAADNLRKSFNKYTEAVKKIEDCEKGTKEWTEALKAANDAALELVNNLPSSVNADTLKELMYYDEVSGRLAINEDIYNEIQSQMDAQANAASYATGVGQIAVQQASLDKQKEDIANKYQYYEQNTSTESEYHSNIKWYTKDDIDKIITAVNTNPSIGAIMNDAEALRKFFTSALDEEKLNNMNDQDLIELASDAVALAGKQNTIDTKANLQAQAQVNSIIGDKYDYTTKQIIGDQLAADTKDYAKKYLGALTNGAYGSKDEKWTDRYGNIRQIDKDLNAKFLAEFQELTGHTDWVGSSNAVQGNDSARFFEFQDAQGNIHKLSAEQVADQMAAGKALQKLDMTAQNLAKTLSNLNDETKSIISGSGLGDYTHSEFTAYKEEVENAGGAKAYLKAQGLTEEVAEKYAPELEASLSLDWDAVLEGIPDALDKTFSENLTYSAAVGLKKAITDVNFGPLGSQAGEDFINGLEEMVSGVNMADRQDAFNALTQIDWSSYDALKQAQEILKGFGVTIDITSDYWQNFADEMRKASGAIPDFTHLRTDLNEISAILNKLDFGSVINEEDYQRLINYSSAVEGLNTNWENFFMLQTDGTRKFIGNSTDMQEVLQDDILAQRAALKEKADIQGSMEKWGHKDSEGNFVKADWNSKTGDVDQGTARNLAQAIDDNSVTGQYLASFGYTSDQLRQWADTAAGGGEGAEEAAASLTQVYQVMSDIVNLDFDAEDSKLDEMLASTARNADELDELLMSGAISIESYNKALTGMQNQLDEDVNVEQYEALSDYIEDAGDAINGLSKDLKGNKKASQDVAKQILRFDAAVGSVTESYTDWKRALTSKNLQDVSKATKELANTYGDLLDIDGSNLSQDFLTNTENLDLMKQAAEGSEEAYKALQAAAGKDILTHLGLDSSQYDSDLALINETHINGTAIEDLEAGASIDDAGFLNQLSNMVTAAGMTAAEATDYLSSMGIDAEVEQVSEPVKEHVATNLTPNVETRTYGEGPSELAVSTVTYDQEPVYSTKTVAGVGLKVTSAKKSSGGNVKYNNSSNASGNAKANKGGGGGGSKKTKKASDEKDRYHEVTKKLDDLGRAYDRLGKHKDHAFGKSYINTIKEETKALDEQINTLNSKLKEAEGYYKEDLAAIEKYGAIVDENGNITNYNAIIEKYVNLFNSGSIDEDAYSEMKDALDRFEDTADTLEDIKNEIEDKVYEKVALEIERIDTEVNMNIEINDEDLQWLEYLLTKIENQSFNIAKQIAIMGYQTDEVFSKINTYTDGLKGLEEEAAKNLANGLFTETGGWDADMKDRAKGFTDGLMEANKTLLEYKQTLTEKFQEAIDEVNETFDNQIGRFDNYTSILESYTEILHLTGKTLKNSDLIIKFGNQQVEVARNQLVALKAQQNTLYASLAEAQQKLADAQARGDQDAIRHWTDEVNNITIQAEEGKANLISSFQEAMSTAADIFASTVEQFSAQAEAALSIYDTLEEAQDAYDRAKERSEWFLDNATQAYELSKLMRNINQQIDKTNNLGAQIKLRDILDEINDIQKNNVKISQDDLDILNAKYELRLAEIALEEAQNAKDTVKLSRNAEGGWGYVYTANQDTTDKAIQDYEDKAYNLEKLIKEKITNISDAILENKVDTLNRIKSLSIQSFESEQEYWDAVNKIREEGLAKDLYLRNGLERVLTEGNLSYADIILKGFENADSLEEGRLIFEQITQDLLDNASNAYAEYTKQTNGLLEALGFESAEDLLTWLQSSADDIVNGANGLSSKLIQYSEESQKAIKEAADAIADYEKKYNDSIKSMMDMSEAMIKTVTEMLRRFGLLDNNATLADFWNGDIAEDHSTPAQYDTGGYTGEWGQAGKLAVLHEKELVLNKNETEDLLKIMDIMRDRVLQDKLNGMEKYLNTAQQVIDNLFKNGTNNELEQNVHITAEFPSVTDHNEIEEAFNNLINSASQYINRY